MTFKGTPAGQYSQLIEGKSVKEIESDVIDYIISLKEERSYTQGSQKAHLNSLIHFYAINDITLNRKKISKFISNDDFVTTTVFSSASNDQSDNNSDSCGYGEKPYTYEQIAKLLEFADLRTKVIILLMCSTGMRIGALPLLRYGDLIEIPKHNIYQIRVYANSKSNRYHTFCTPECRKVIDNYVEFRRTCGENITPKSPLLRQEFDRENIFQVANVVKPLTGFAIKRALQKVLYASGIRTPLVSSNSNEQKKLNTKRETAMSHGFRKFFDTTCTHSGMNQTYIEFCLGHKLPGVKDSYFLPQPDSNGVYMDILEGRDKCPGYLDAIPYLTIDDAQRLKRENEMLKVNKSEIEQLKEQAEKYKSFMSALNPQIEEFQREINSLKLHLNSENSKKNSNKKKSSSGNKQETENITTHGH
jgi:integrase